MTSPWKKVKRFLSARLCLAASLVSRDFFDDSVEPSDGPITPCSEPVLGSRSTFTRVHSLTVGRDGIGVSTANSVPSPETLSHNSTKFSRSTCSICLEAMGPGQGQALFTAECSHVFHFSCITSNVRHGNHICPVCRAKWKDVPWKASKGVAKAHSRRHLSHVRNQAIPRSLSHVGRLSSPNLAEEEQMRISSLLHMFDESIARRPNQTGEPDFYDDDEPVVQPIIDADSATTDHRVIVKCLPEVAAIPASESRHNFNVLVHLKAPPTSNGFPCHFNPTFRVPVDLVAVLDISGSMAGTKLKLLKQAMAFVIRNLSSSDRLSVVVFSSSAKRIFPLRRMGEEGQQGLLQAITALSSTGGTNIAEGLRKGVKVLEDRKERNPVSSIILLSDGQDTYNLRSQRQSILFSSGRGFNNSQWPIYHRRYHEHMQVPVHTFGFGVDHDSTTMHAISEMSGGTFSFVQAEEAVQDAFAQCIGGLLSVVIQDVELTVSCVDPSVRIATIKAGSYESSITDDARYGAIKLGVLYAEEERDVLLELDVPMYEVSDWMPLLQTGCIYKDPMTQRLNQCIADELCISRPKTLAEKQELSLEVDRQRSRLWVAEVIAEARSLADQGDLTTAQANLQNVKTALENSVSACAGDHFSIALEAELTEIQERMTNQYLYERTGRAYLLSAQSSHQRQRATTRGESLNIVLDGSNHDYQTPSMVDMVTLSQTMSFSQLSGSRAPGSSVRSSQGSAADVPVSSHPLQQGAKRIWRN